MLLIIYLHSFFKFSSKLNLILFFICFSIVQYLSTSNIVLLVLFSILYICPTCNGSLRATPDFATATRCLGPLALLQLPFPAVLLYIFLELHSAPRQSYCCVYMYIYIILELQLSWHFPLPGHRNFVLVHHSVPVHHLLLLVRHSCTTT